MNEYRLLRTIRLTSAHQPTGRTKHLVGGEPVPTPAELRIAQYEGDAGYYLFYCDESGAEITDTYHDSLDEAMSQAEWEFGTKEDEWRNTEV